MNSKPIKIPGLDHPITITPTKSRVTVVVNGKRVADSREALTLREAAIPMCNTHPAQGRGHDATATDIASDVLSLQGRVRLLQHSARRGALGQCGLELPTPTSTAIRGCP
jgi:hypothetical protein